jgi:hypothetical protein
MRDGTSARLTIRDLERMLAKRRSALDELISSRATGLRRRDRENAKMAAGRRTSKKPFAYHEAGHVVALWARGKVCFDASIDPKVARYFAGDGADGCTNTVGPSTRKEALAAIITYYAGPEAERTFDPKCAAGLPCSDRVSIEYEAAKFRIDGKTLARLRTRARQIVRQHWSDIEQVAAELLKHKTIPFKPMAELKARLFPQSENKGC